MDKEGNPWFVARDVGKVLGFSDSSSVVKFVNKLKDIHKGRISIHTPGGLQKVSIISEQGLYKMLIQSRKPEAVPQFGRGLVSNASSWEFDSPRW